MAVDVDGARGTGAGVVMHEGRRCGDRAQQQVVVVEESRPRGPVALAFVVVHEPLAVAHRHRVVDQRLVVALAVVVPVGPGLRVAPHRLVGQRAGGGSQQHEVVLVELVLVDVGSGFADVGTGGCQRIHRPLQRVDHGGRIADHRRVEHHAYPERTQRVTVLWCQRHAVAVRIQAGRPGEHIERHIQIGSAARQRPAHGDVAADQRAGHRVTRVGHQAVGRLVAEHAAVVRRVSDGRADVGAQFQRGHAGRQRHRRTPRRSAGYAVQVPRVVGAAVDVVEALPVAQHERHIGLAPDHRARIEVARHRDSVGVGHVVGPRRVAPRRRGANPVECFLDGHRHAVQRPPALPGRQRRVGGSSPLARLVDPGHNHRVHRGVEALVAVDRALQRFRCRHATLTDQRGQLDGRQEVRICVGFARHRAETRSQPGPASALRSPARVSRSAPTQPANAAAAPSSRKSMSSSVAARLMLPNPPPER